MTRGHLSDSAKSMNDIQQNSCVKAHVFIAVWEMQAFPIQPAIGDIGLQAPNNPLED